MYWAIRKMTKDDIKQVQDIAKKSWDVTYDKIIPRHIQDNFLKTYYSDEMMHRRLKYSLVLVAEIEHQVVGFANFSYVNDQGEAELSAIYLYPHLQGHGIGTALLQKGIETLENAKKIYVNVEKENNIGRSFYEAKGFKVIKQFDENIDGHILKTIRMCLTL